MPASRNQETELAQLERAQAGDRSAFEELVRLHYTYITSIVYRMCGEMAMAEDAAQETFLRAWLHLPSYHPESSLRSWLCRIAVNATLDVLRRRKDAPAGPERMESLPDRTPGPEAAMIEKEQVAFLQRTMASLPEGARSVLVLREYGELSYQEIALVLDIPVGTVMSRLNYARNRLRELLKEQWAQAELEYA